MAVRDFLQDADGDLAVENGDFQTVADAAAVPQGIGIRCRSVLKEIWLDEEQGVPWTEVVLVKNPDPLVVREVFREAIMDTPDTVDASGTDLQVDHATREGAIDFKVGTIYGQPVEGQVSTPDVSAVV